MKLNCVICSGNISIEPTRNYCFKCGARYNKQMKLIYERHNWNLKDYSKSLSADSELCHLKHQS